MRLNKKYLIIFISGILFYFIVSTIVNINPRKSVRIDGSRYVNQQVIVPKTYIDGKIGSKDGLAYYKIKGANENYQIAVKFDNEYYFYKTKDANGINFTD